MAVNWNMAGGGFNALQTLQAFGAAQQQRMTQQQAEMQQAQAMREQQARGVVSQRAATGDYRGAQQAAVSAGDFDLATQVQRLGAQDQERLKAEADAIGRVAFSLSSIPQEQRQQALRSMLPALRSAGISDQEIAQADLSDQGLRGYISLATSINDQFQQSQPRYQVIPEGGTLVDTRNPDAIRQVSQPQPQQGGADLEAMAQQAIAQGADPAAVRARLEQMRGGAAPQANAPFVTP